VAWRRAAGASIMFGGAGVIASAAAMATFAVASDVQAGSEAFTMLAQLRDGWVWPASGVAAMLAGRLVYGHWRAAAPIAHVTGLVTRTVGLLVAFGLGAMLAFLLASGFEREDAPAAAALAVGMIAGLLLAHVGVGLRNTHQYYPRNYSVSSDVPE
jgi:hypothetical protein